MDDFTCCETSLHISQSYPSLGQEIVLKRYYGQVPTGVDDERGFLQMAMSHLRSNSDGDSPSPSRQPRTPGVQKKSKYNRETLHGGSL